MGLSAIFKRDTSTSPNGDTPSVDNNKDDHATRLGYAVFELVALLTEEIRLREEARADMGKGVAADEKDDKKVN